MRGRKPKPTEVKRLEGNPGGRALNDAEPLPPTTPAILDATPAELEGDPVAIAEWRYLEPTLRRIRQITDVDRAALVALCLQTSRYLEAHRKVKVSGLVVKTPRGYPMPNPYVAIENRALGACIKLWAELGLTPSSRSRVRTADDEPVLPAAATDEFAEFDDDDDDGRSTH